MQQIRVRQVRRLDSGELVLVLNQSGTRYEVVTVDDVEGACSFLQNGAPVAAGRQMSEAGLASSEVVEDLTEIE